MVAILETRFIERLICKTDDSVPVLLTSGALQSFFCGILSFRSDLGSGDGSHFLAGCLVERELPTADILLGPAGDRVLLSAALLGRGSLGESAMLLMGAGSCLLTATEVCGAVTVLKVAIEDLDGELPNN